MVFQLIFKSCIEKAPGSNCSTVTSFSSPFTFVSNTGIFGSQNSAITCLQAPHGEIGPSVSPVITK